jgi:hypothetical protein
MTPTTSDLKALFDDVSAATTEIPRLAARAAAEGERIRRRRTGVAVAGSALAAALAVGAVLLPMVDRTTTVPPVHRPSPDSSQIPEYRDGGRLISVALADDPRGVELTFVAGERPFFFTAECARADPAGANAWLAVDGHKIMGAPCGEALPAAESDGVAGMSGRVMRDEWGIAPGDEVTATLRYRDGTSHLGTEWRLAAYEPVPIADYPFPDPPLGPLPDPPGLKREPDARIWGDGSTAPDGFSYTFRVESRLRIRSVTIAPGELRILVDGKVVFRDESWDYDEDYQYSELSLRRLGVERGEEITVTVEAERFTGNQYAFMVSGGQ